MLLQFALVSGGVGTGRVYAESAVSKLVLSTNTVNLAVGSSKTLTATAVYESGSSSDATIKTEWSSGDESVATVYNGTILAKSVGSTIVTATYSGKTVAVQVTVTKKVNSLTKNTSKVDMRIGENKQINLTAIYSDNTTENVNSMAEWSISNDSVATVANGEITGLQSGSAVITAKYGGLSVTVQVNVDIAKRIDPDTASFSLKTGEERQIKLMAKFNDGTVQDVAPYAEWSTSNAQVADVLKGMITAYGSGEAEITASYGTATAKIKVAVEMAKRITLSETDVFIQEGETKAITVKATFEDGTAEDVTADTKWTSSDDSVAYAVNGKIFGYSVGQAVITAEYGSRTATVTVDVGVPRQLKASASSVSLRKNATREIGISAVYSDGTTADVTDKVDWESSNESVAYAEGGKIYTLASGSAVLTARYGNKSTTVQVSVDTARKLNISDTSLMMRSGDTKDLTLTVTYTDGTKADVTDEAAWSVDDSSIVGVHKGAITAKSSGQATVTATYGSETVTATVSVDAAKNLVLDETDLFLSKSGSKAVTLKAHYADGTSETITDKAVWTSSSESVAYVSKGTVTAVAPGQATITAAYGGKTASLIVDVAVARKLQLSHSTVSLRKGATQNVTLKATYADGTTEDVTSSVEWSSSDESITYAAKGTVYAYKAGEATITASYGSKTATFTVRVDTASSLKADTTKLVLQPDDNAQVKLSASFADGTPEDVTSSAEWVSKDPAVATVKNGLITAIARGATSVTASYGNKTVKITVSVGEITQLTVNKSSVVLKDGEIGQIAAIATFKDGSTKDVTEEAEWTSSDSTIARVSYGMLTGIKSGEATVTAAYGDLKATVKVEVELAKSLSVSKRTVIMEKDTSYQLSLTMTDSEGKVQDVTSKAAWTSTSPAIADVVNGLVTSYAQGKATVTGKYGGKTMSVAIEVDAPAKLVLNQKNLQLISGQTAALTVTAEFSDGTSRDVTEEAEWSSSNAKYADVHDGAVSAVSSGKATITAKYGGKSVSTAVEVDKLKYLKVNTHRITMKPGETQVVTLTATYADGTDAKVNAKADWSSSKESVADVKDGVITAEFKGTANIRAKYAGKTVSITVIVQ